MKLHILGILLVSTLAVCVASQKRILFLSPVNGKSHWNYLKFFIRELIGRGYDVTCITSIPMNDKKLSNYTEILVDPPFQLDSIIKVFKQESLDVLQTVNIFSEFGYASAAHTLNNKKVQEFINRNDLHFDLIINEDVYHDVFLVFGHKFKAPVVTICPFGIPDNFDYEMGLQTPLSHVGHVVLSYTDRMDFSERWYNTMITIYDNILRKFYHIPKQTELIKKYFGHLEPLPSVDELRKNISVIFVNAHRSITHPRPQMPGIVYIGGAHIKPPKPLPDDLQKFMDEAPQGVIYFSLGTVIESKMMSKEKLNIFLNCFRQLKQRVIWKFEDDSIPNLPKNVMIRKWLPQTDIFAHPNVVMFISHGGMYSNFEALKYGIQMLVFPFGGDQYRNAYRVEASGYGKMMSFNDLSDQSLNDAVHEMLTSTVYSNRAKEISAIFNDNLVHPMDEFIWWIEYVIKFRGAKHLKSHAADMPLFSYLLLDVILVNLSILFAVIYCIYCVIRRCWSKKISIQSQKKKQQ